MVIKKLYGPIAVFIGTTIGAGIFSLPYVLSRAGIVPFLVFFVLSFLIVLFISLMLAEISLNIKTRHRLPGYVNEILGSKMRTVALVTMLTAGIGGLLIYIILGSTFLRVLLFGTLGDNLIIYALIFYLFHALNVFRGIRVIERIDKMFETLLIAVVIIISFLAFRKFDTGSLALVTENAYLPYGALLFSFSGMSIIPQISELVGKDAPVLRKTITRGLFIVAVVYALFAFSIAGAMGNATATDALSGLAARVGTLAVYLGSLVGFISLGTAFDSFGVTLRDTLKFDLKFPLLSYLVLILPLVLYLMGLQNLIAIIGIVGAIFLAIDGALIILSHRKLSPKMKVRMMPRMPGFVYLFLLLIFGAGIVAALYTAL